MKKTIASLILVTFAVTLLSVAPPQEPADNKTLWKQYEEALKKGLPKTAITHLEPIIVRALKDKDYAEAIKAIGGELISVHVIARPHGDVGTVLPKPAKQ